MRRDSHLEKLLLKWEQAQDQGQILSAEELCPDSPEYRDELRRRIRALRAMEELLTTTNGRRDARTTVSVLAEPPALPGYEILGELGRGGMGVIYKALQKGPNRIVALKMILSGSHAGPGELARFRAEAEKMARLQHPHIVQIFEVNEYEGRPYFSLEYVGGGTLADKLSGTPYPARQAAALVETLSRAVQAAHLAGIIHRDLKPGNILLTEDGTPKITDFGLAKRLDAETHHTPSGAVLGTPSYMAPEQASGKSKEIGPAADVYALGAILYELLGGRPPFKGESLWDTVHQVMTVEPVSPRHLQPTVPRDLETICLKCLQKDPRKRYGSAGALADDLQRFLRGEPVCARPVSHAEQLWRWCCRRPAVASLLLAVAVVLVSGILVSVHFAIQAREQAVVASAHAQQAEARATEARANLYAAHMNLAQLAWDNHNWERLVGFLERYAEPPPDQPDPRGWEWHYLWGLCHADLCQTLRGHTSWVKSVAFSPDGALLATGSKDTTIKLWDLGRSRELRTLRGHRDMVQRVVFSPDGRRLASASGDGKLKIWDAQIGQVLHSLEGHGDGVRGVAFSPDGRHLASGSADNTVKLWDAASGRHLRTLKGHTDWANAVAFSPDGRRLASASDDGTVKIWDPDSGQELRTLQGHSDQVSGVAFSPDGRQVAASSWNCTVRIWDVESSAVLQVLRGPLDFRGVVFSPDGKRLGTAGGDHAVRLWDAATGRELRTLRGHTHVVQGVAFSPDGTRLASAGEDGTVRLWDVTEGPAPLTFKGHRMEVYGVAFSPDGHLLASGSGDGTARVWDAATGQELHTLRGHTASVNKVAFSPDSRYVASTSRDKTVKVWDVATGQELHTLKGHADWVHNVAFSPDGRHLASASKDRTVKLWDAVNGREIRTVSGYGHYVAFSPDGTRLASASNDKAVKICDVKNGREISSLTGHMDEVLDVRFSADGTWLASASGDKSVKVWNMTTGQELRTLKGHTDTVYCVGFTSDGRRLVSSSKDHTIKVWDVATGQEVHTVKANAGPIVDVAFSADGHWLAAACRDRTVKVWDGRPLTEEVRTEREALRLVQFLFARPLFRRQVLESLRANRSIRDEVRDRAVLLVERYRDGPQFNAASWAIARKLDAAAARYQQAVAWAQTAHQLEPQRGAYLTTLGVAQYRAGQYQQAVATLTQAVHANAQLAIPTELAFLAMAHRRLGQNAEAQACLQQLHELLGKRSQHAEWWEVDEEVHAFVREAEELVPIHS